MWDTYATNNTILYDNTKFAILTYNEILTLLTELYSTLYIYTYKKKKKKNSNLHYLHYGLHTLQKPENKGVGEVW